MGETNKICQTRCYKLLSRGNGSVIAFYKMSFPRSLSSRKRGVGIQAYYSLIFWIPASAGMTKEMVTDRLHQEGKNS